MAFQLNKDLNNGFIAGYAVVAHLTIDFINKSSVMNINYYKDVTSFQSGLDPVRVETQQLDGPEFPFDPVTLKSSSALDLAYSSLVLKPDFQSAVIVPDVAVEVPPEPVKP